MNSQKILFVCMGNICRSPSAEGVFRKILNDRNLHHHVETDSAGTEGWHTGSAPDKRAQHAASQRGIDISELRARQVSPADIEFYDLIIAMDHDNQSRLHSLAGEQHAHKIRLLLEYSKLFNDTEVPDPYYGGDHGFDLVLDMIEESCQQLIQHIVDHNGGHHSQ
jgi:protein-tyrosine phosphatase